jgi:hypothetical protein
VEPLLSFVVGHLPEDLQDVLELFSLGDISSTSALVPSSLRGLSK